MTEKLFREQGRTGISLDKFRNFLKKLQEGMIKLEFAHYDVKGGPKSKEHACSPALPPAQCTACGMSRLCRYKDNLLHIAS
jgi:hypothetical protein